MSNNESIPPRLRRQRDNYDYRRQWIQSLLDLNQVKAGEAASLDQSNYTAIGARIRAWRVEQAQASLEKFHRMREEAIPRDGPMGRRADAGQPRSNGRARSTAPITAGVAASRVPAEPGPLVFAG